jgi:hypothetical protein
MDAALGEWSQMHSRLAIPCDKNSASHAPVLVLFLSQCEKSRFHNRFLSSHTCSDTSPSNNIIPYVNFYGHYLYLKRLGRHCYRLLFSKVNQSSVKNVKFKH